MNVLIDCGGHLGEGLTAMIDKYKINNDWKVFSFEPNRDSFQQIIQKPFEVSGINFINKAIWINENKIIFNAETPADSGKNDGAGSSIIDLNDWKPKNPDNLGVGNFNNSYEVDCVDLSKFIKENFNKSDFIVIKLDIEGAEFEVLNKLIKTGAIKYVDELYVEFHDWARKSKTKLSKLIIKLKIRFHNRKINLTEWY